MSLLSHSSISSSLETGGADFPVVANPLESATLTTQFLGKKVERPQSRISVYSAEDTIE
jgi:hypothetical protein